MPAWGAAASSPEAHRPEEVRADLHRPWLRTAAATLALAAASWSVGDGTAASCTGDAFIDAVAAGGVITFDCGPDPVTITLERPAKIFNDTGPEIVIDGGGKVTLSGGGSTRILYMNTCDPTRCGPRRLRQPGPPAAHRPEPHVRRRQLEDEAEYDGGGAIWARGGRFKVVNSRFFGNVCADTGPDVGGAGVRAFDQFEGLPVYVVNSTFGGADGFGNTCSNGGGISSIGVSWSIFNSLFSHNHAIGNGANPPSTGTPAAAAAAPSTTTATR